MVPTLEVENCLIAEGASCIIGFDEVGKGAWAGPLVVGAAVLRPEVFTGDLPEVLAKVRDSKALSEKRRELLFDDLGAICAAWSIGAASHAECDELGMSAAQRLAARRACAALRIDLARAAAVLDGNWDFVGSQVGKVITQVKADASSLSVAAASILAKVSRDRQMRDMARDYPLWSFDTNKGYPCAKHRRALQGYGPSAVHRTSWAFMGNFVPWLTTGVAHA